MLRVLCRSWLYYLIGLKPKPVSAGILDDLLMPPLLFHFLIIIYFFFLFVLGGVVVSGTSFSCIFLVAFKQISNGSNANCSCKLAFHDVDCFV